MPRAHSARVVVWAFWALVAVALAIAGRLAIAEQPSSAAGRSATSAAQSAPSRPEAPAETPVPEKPQPKKREFRGRLPAYYSRVVDAKQRETIYGIQRGYAPKIDALRAELEALIAERDEKVAAVLTPEQLATVEKLKAESKAKRSAAPKGDSE